MKGRKKIDKDLNNLHGNPGKRKPGTRLNFTSSDKKFGLPKGLDKEVREKCRDMAHYMEEQGAPIEFMRTMFERYCKHIQAAYKAFKGLNGNTWDTGLIIDRKKNPLAQIWKDNSESALRLEAQFERILGKTKPTEKEEDPLKKYGLSRVK